MIEYDFDISFIGGLALREKQIQQSYRPIIAVHKWSLREGLRMIKKESFTGWPNSTPRVDLKPVFDASHFRLALHTWQVKSYGGAFRYCDPMASLQLGGEQ
jgi:hypothetical protein